MPLLCLQIWNGVGFSNNQASGGAVLAVSMDLTSISIKNATFVNNVADFSGGGEQ